MLKGDVMDVQFIASVAVITPESSVSRRLYLDRLRLPLAAARDDYLHSEDIDGAKLFGLWPLSQAAQACFDASGWPANRPVPQANIEFELAETDSVQAAAEELREKGFTLLHEPRVEPWTDRRSVSVKRGRNHRPVLRPRDAFVARPKVRAERSVCGRAARRGTDERDVGDAGVGVAPE